MVTTPVRELVLEALAENDGRRLTEIHNAIRAKHDARHSIQGTKKALASLLKERVIEKAEYKYFISMDWAVREKAFVDGVIAAKARKKYTSFDRKSDYNVLSFDNLFELDNFWNHTVLKVAKEERRWLAINHFSWFLIVNMGFETSVVSELKKQGIPCVLAINKEYRLNQWAANVYRALGAKVMLLDKKNFPASTDLNLFRDTILEVKYDPKVFKVIEAIFRRYTAIEDIPLKTVAQLSTMKGHHEMKIIRDTALAQRLQAQYKVG